MAIQPLSSFLLRPKFLPCVITHLPFRVSLSSVNSSMIDAGRFARPYTMSSKSGPCVGIVKSYEFSDIVEITTSPPSSKRALIDVREHTELHHHGTIPGSLNIPLNSFPDAFTMTADKFKEVIGFTRPSKEVELIFFCQAGIRSSQAAERAIKAGWSRVGNYSGSWLDWSAQGGKILEVTPPV